MIDMRARREETARERQAEHKRTTRVTTQLREQASERAAFEAELRKVGSTTGAARSRQIAAPQPARRDQQQDSAPQRPAAAVQAAPCAPPASAAPVRGEAAAPAPAGDALATTAPSRQSAASMQQPAGWVYVQPALAARVITDAAIGMQEGRKELRLHLDPEHLGPLVVEIAVEKGIVSARLSTRTAQAARILGADSQRLQRLLRELGYARADVSVEHRDEEEFFTP